ncbi:MAG: alpha/beta fold hydrolase [Candidatus Nitrosopolaris sp.]
MRSSQIRSVYDFTMLSTVIMIVTLIGCSSIFLYLFGKDTANIFMIYAQMQSTNSSQSGQKVSFLTDDGVLIVGTYYSHSSSHQTAPTNAIILLHMLGRNRNDWNTFASTLSNRSNGLAVLSIDLRGHGESINQNGKTISFQSFTPTDFNKMVLDVKAAKHFLVTQKNISTNNIAIVGASIGANVGLKYAASDPSIKAVVLLSPGLNYKGVTTSDSIRKYINPIYIATAGKDPIAGSDPQTLCNEINCGNRLKAYQDSNSHGTDMFSDSSLNPSLDNLIISWLALGKSK